MPCNKANGLRYIVFLVPQNDLLLEWLPAERYMMNRASVLGVADMPALGSKIDFVDQDHCLSAIFDAELCKNRRYVGLHRGH